MEKAYADEAKAREQALTAYAKEIDAIEPRPQQFGDPTSGGRAL